MEERRQPAEHGGLPSIGPNMDESAGGAQQAGRAEWAMRGHAGCRPRERSGRSSTRPMRAQARQPSLFPVFEMGRAAMQ